MLCSMWSTEEKGKIAWDKIEKELGNGKKEVLYSGDIPLPRGLKRYRSHALMHRMAENAALEALSRLKLPPYRLRLGLFDPDGLNDGMLRLLLPFSSCINAVSGNMKAYIDRADEIMEESGAFISVHKSIGCLESCHVVIAPEKSAWSFRFRTIPSCLQVKSPPSACAGLFSTGIPSPCRKI